METPALSHVEETILAELGHAWQSSELTPDTLRDARRSWLDLRTAAGFTGAGRWVTTSSTNPKMAKSGLPTVGVTLHSTTRAARTWLSLDDATREAIAASLGTDPEEVRRRLMQTVCPHATSGCSASCVTSMSANSHVGKASLSRLTRTLFHLFRPAAAFCLTGHELRRLAAKHGAECRWRVNVSDDVRWELLAPGLFDFGVPGYAYTKWPAELRTGRPDLSLVYSATERTPDETIVGLVRSGHRVAVVFDAKPTALPSTWRGVRVSDGNVTDDLWAHDRGTIVGLSAKAPTKAIKDAMRRSGFARPAA